MLDGVRLQSVKKLRLETNVETKERAHANADARKSAPERFIVAADKSECGCDCVPNQNKIKFKDTSPEDFD